MVFGALRGPIFYLALAKHLPIALHLAGILQPGHGLNGAAFLPAFAGALAIITFSYMVVPYFILEVDLVAITISPY